MQQPLGDVGQRLRVRLARIDQEKLGAGLEVLFELRAQHPPMCVEANVHVVEPGRARKRRLERRTRAGRLGHVRLSLADLPQDDAFLQVVGKALRVGQDPVKHTPSSGPVALLSSQVSKAGERRKAPVAQPGGGQVLQDAPQDPPRGRPVSPRQEMARDSNLRCALDTGKRAPERPGTVDVPDRQRDANHARGDERGERANLVLDVPEARCRVARSAACLVRAARGVERRRKVK
jgi:hypothetical protein